jgi:predicted ATPase
VIASISFKNFKSLYDNEVKLNRFCVFIGANGSGKSNIIDAFKFVRESLLNDVGAAVGKRFGWQQLYSKSPGRKKEIRFQFFFNFSENESHILIDKEKRLLSSNYSLEIGHSKNKSFIKSEKLESNILKKDETNYQSKFIRTKSEVHLFEDDPNSSDRGTKRFAVPEMAQQSPFLIAPFGSEASADIALLIRNWKFYDIDHIAARKPSNNEDDNHLTEDGSNLAVILNKISSLKHYENLKHRIENLMNLMIPSFTSWRVERQFDGSIGYKVLEARNEFLPKMVSDGTIRLLSLLVALLYNHRPNQLIAIDEPERCLHPQAVKTLVDLMRETSKDKQILITTHSAEIVKWLRPEEIYLVDKIDGKTIILPATEVTNIDVFLENFSMDELWLGGYLKGGTIN